MSKLKLTDDQEFNEMIHDVLNDLSTDTTIGVGMIGNVDSGKSTLVSNLTNRILDDGGGSSRQRVFVHDHEKTRGQTSDVSHQILYFTEDHINNIARSIVVNEGKKKESRFYNNDKLKCITCYDLCGHKKYFGTTASFMADLDYVILVIEPAKGIQKMSLEHTKIAMSMNIPIMIVVTKIDIATENKIKRVYKQIASMLKLYKREPKYITDYSDFVKYTIGEEIFSTLCEINNVSYYVDKSKLKYNDLLTTMRNDDNEFLIELKQYMNSYTDFNDKYSYELTDDEFECLNTYVMYNDRSIDCIKNSIRSYSIDNDNSNSRQLSVPINFVSNVTGYGLDIVRGTMAFLKERDIWSTNGNTIVKAMKKKLKINFDDVMEEDDTVFYVEKSYNVEGHGIVLYGINRGKPLTVNQICYVGPFEKNLYTIKIKSIRNDNDYPMDELANHTRGCICISLVNANNVGSSKFKLKKDMFRGGDVVLSNNRLKRFIGYRFQAAFVVLNHNAEIITMREGSSLILHINSGKNTARIIGIGTDKDPFCDSKDLTEILGIKSNCLADKTELKKISKITFKLMYAPAYLHPGQLFFVRSSSIHAVGLITQVLPIESDPYAIPENKKNKRQLYSVAEKVKLNTRPRVIIPNRTSVDNSTLSDNSLNSSSLNSNSLNSSSLNSFNDTTFKTVKL